MLILQFGLTGGYARWLHPRAAARFRAVRVRRSASASGASPRARGVARGMRRRGHNYGLGGKLGAEELAESAASSSIGMGSSNTHSHSLQPVSTVVVGAGEEVAKWPPCPSVSVTGVTRDGVTIPSYPKSHLTYPTHPPPCKIRAAENSFAAKLIILLQN